MPNQRSNEKVILSAYVPRALKEKFEDAAQEQGVTMSKFLVQLCIAATGFSAKKKTAKKRPTSR